jgi:hypothetical protein
MPNRPGPEAGEAVRAPAASGGVIAPSAPNEPSQRANFEPIEMVMTGGGIAEVFTR